MVSPGLGSCSTANPIMTCSALMVDLFSSQMMVIVSVRVVILISHLLVYDHFGRDSC